MEVILLERIDKLGQMGEVVKVKDGYARNFLLPQHKALRATEANRAQVRARPRAARGQATRSAARRAMGDSGKLDGKSFVILRQAGESGQLYGSVSTRDIAEIASTARYRTSRATRCCSIRRSRPSASTRCRSRSIRSSRSR